MLPSRKVASSTTYGWGIGPKAPGASIPCVAPPSQCRLIHGDIDTRGLLLGPQTSRLLYHSADNSPLSPSYLHTTPIAALSFVLSELASRLQGNARARQKLRRGSHWGPVAGSKFSLLSEAKDYILVDT